MPVIMEERPWHEGEDAMHRRLKVPNTENPSAPFLSPGGAYMLQMSPLVALGTVDSKGRPWATIWGGEAGFARQVGPSIIGARTVVDGDFDPVVKILFNNKRDGEIVREEGPGRMISGLAIDLESRRRLKLYGRMITGSLGDVEQASEQEGSKGAAEVQLVIKIEESLGNCPKYLNQKQIHPALPDPRLISDSRQLPPEALALIAKADLFFVSSANRDIDMDCNHRGGPPGFLRVASNETSGAVLVWPEYSGNRLFQTLGNFMVSPKAGMIIPDFETGDVLYLTGKTRVLVGHDAASVLPRSNLAVRIQVTSAIFVENGLPFRGAPLDPSPYNPTVRYLANERLDPTSAVSTNPSSSSPTTTTTTTARLLHKQKLTPTITRYRYALSEPPSKPFTPGQYIALSFRDELDLGYSHMRDDDPQSLNDDFVRTFTISSAPPSSSPHISNNNTEFELTVRNVGRVTGWMAQQNPRTGTEIPVVGIGGDFRVDPSPSSTTTVIPFVAGGIGITPLLPSLPTLDLRRLRLFWAVNVYDLGLVRDTFERHPGLAARTALFVSGITSYHHHRADDDDDDGDGGGGGGAFRGLEGAEIRRRRLEKQDLFVEEEDEDGAGAGVDSTATEWYLCCGPRMRKDVLQWLGGRTVHWENFDY